MSPADLFNRIAFKSLILSVPDELVASLPIGVAISFEEFRNNLLNQSMV